MQHAIAAPPLADLLALLSDWELLHYAACSNSASIRLSPSQQRHLLEPMKQFRREQSPGVSIERFTHPVIPAEVQAEPAAEVVSAAIVTAATVTAPIVMAPIVIEPPTQPVKKLEASDESTTRGVVSVEFQRGTAAGKGLAMTYLNHRGARSIEARRSAMPSFVILCCRPSVLRVISPRDLKSLSPRRPVSLSANVAQSLSLVPMAMSNNAAKCFGVNVG